MYVALCVHLPFPLQQPIHSVTLPNGHAVPIKSIGSVQLFDNLPLSDVLFVPDFHFNLISMY